MAIAVADNFSYKGSKPLDARIKYNTVADMRDAIESDLYDGCLAYVKENKKYYTYDSDNTESVETGKWKEFSSGGSGNTDSRTPQSKLNSLKFGNYDNIGGGINVNISTEGE